ncbi:hypothetical protein IHE44_0007420, partial [Lamprotornis superbus]
QRIEIHKLRQGDNLILGFSIGGGIDQDPTQNPFSEDKTDKGIYVTRVTEGGPAEVAGLQIGDKIMQVNGWDMTMVTHDQARKRLTKRNEEVVRLLVTRQSLQKAVQQSMITQTHLVDAALNDGEETQGYCVETEENIIDGHRVHPAGITDQEFLLEYSAGAQETEVTSERRADGKRSTGIPGEM